MRETPTVCEWATRSVASVGEESRGREWREREKKKEEEGAFRDGDKRRPRPVDPVVRLRWPGGVVCLGCVCAGVAAGRRMARMGNVMCREEDGQGWRSCFASVWR